MFLLSAYSGTFPLMFNNYQALLLTTAANQLLHDIKQLEKSNEAVADTQGVLRTLPSSNYPFSKLSPGKSKGKNY